MRITLVAALVLGATPALADTIEAPATIRAVTLFPQGAQVVRDIEIKGAEGKSAQGPHEVLVPGLPKGTDISTLRVSGEGVQIGAVSLIDGRAPALSDQSSAQIKAAQARLQQAREALANSQDQVATIRAKAQAAADQITFLKGAGTQLSDPAQLQAMAQMVGDQILAASERVIAAKADARRAEDALKPLQEAVKQAQAALDALQNPAQDHDVLRAMVSGTGTLTITSFVGNAGWQPTYDLRLDRAAGQLDMERFVSVHQATGEDWRGVDLTLSTARPGGQSAPTAIYPRLARIGPPMVAQPLSKSLSRTAGAPAPMRTEAAMTDTAALQMQGETVTYHYPTAVDLRDGVDDLRLKLDAKTIPVNVLAEAVPLSDPQAYRVAEGKNETGEILLPGPANLFADGALVGQTHLPMIAAGDKLRLGFGAIEGIRLTRTMPDTSEGDRGFISKSNARREVVQIEVKNLTAQDWPMRVIDQVPYSEQDDLKIETTATPPATETDYDQKRGVLAWQFDLPAGADKQLRTETTLSWPTDQVLR
ncbi:mucoidy inhibitor MuiA family protein [uncultured Thioclava sp.]|uniref:mucoidy inhibitor MuiA family protein n=1 Tax=uncultured Thioclava sp. TaxID=473858 RepID=UPI0025F3EC2A|nr:mucoidy inhibitor MuiA family protein [uncultured Thioclava sp.]